MTNVVYYVISSNIPAKLQLYLIIVHLRLQVVHLEDKVKFKILTLLEIIIFYAILRSL